MDGLLDKDYAEGRKTKKSLKYRLWRRGNEVTRAINQYIIPLNTNKKKLKVLDLGCADGLMLINLSKKFDIEATGVELSKGLYEKAIKNCPDFNILNKDINNLDFLENQKFDLIICTAVLEHLENPLLTVNFIKDILSPDGITVWTVPDPFWEHIATAVGHLKEEQHHNIPNLTQLRDLAESNGLKVIEAKKFMFSPIGFPFEILIEKFIRKLYLSFMMANQLIIAKKQIKKDYLNTSL